jgi:hypothetical protein
MKNLSKEELSRGVLAASAGNHAQGVAMSALRLGTKATIVMPVTTPEIKISSVRALGANIVLFGDSYSDCVEEAMRLVKEKGVLLCGGSSLAGAEGTVKMKEYVRANAGKISGGHVTAPINLVNEYGNFWFYSQHLVQMITETFGQNVQSVEAKMSANGAGVHAIYHYPEFDVTAFFGAGYSITVYNGGYGAVSEVVNLGGDYFMPELRETNDMLTKRHVRQTPEEVVYPVLVLDATIRAIESGRTEELQAL